MKITKDDTIKFWSRVQIGDKQDCWDWDNPTHAFGYGWFRVEGKNKLAHRVAKIISDGEEKELQVLHSCDNPACCNHNHLRWGTQKDNISDCIKRNRFSYPPRNGCNPPTHYGEDNYNAKMTEEKVLQLRKERLCGVSAKQLSEKYGIKKITVYQIISNRTWKNISRINI